MNTASSQLNDLISERKKISKARDLTWDEDEVKYGNEYHEEYDTNRDLIFILIKENFDTLSLEDILEAYSHTGGAPCLIYDDDGNWAITTEGYQSINLEDTPQDLDASFFIEARFFKPNIREALKYWFGDMLSETYKVD